MSTTDPVIRASMAAPERSGGDDLSDVELVIRRARAGDLTENEAFEDIDRIARRRDPVDPYRKSWT
ncbi:MAG: hypothetical protein K0M78_06305 [Brevundimonas sp.]|nr:hypothetical protein [Brevundimonas sp.]